MAPRELLAEPLLRDSEDQDEGEDQDQVQEGDSACPGLSDIDNQNENNSGHHDAAESAEAFSVKAELREMLGLGLPLAVSFFCRMGMASTDSAFVGHISDGRHSPETYLAAAVLSDMCVSVFVAPPLAFNQVLNGLVSQAVGSGNPRMAGVWLQQSMFWLALLMLPCLAGFFHVEPLLLALDFPEDVAAVAGTYAKYNILWPIPNGLYQCMRFYFQAQGLPRPAMYNNIVFLFLNAFFNWIFVFGGPFRYVWGWKGLGFIGAAISLSISRTMQSVTYFIYMFLYKQHHLSTWPGLSLEHHTRGRTAEFMKQSLPNLGTLLFSVLSGQATTVLVGRLGEGAMAAGSALSTVTVPWSGTLSATGCTVSGVRVGYHLGRGDGRAARRSAWLVLASITAAVLLVAAAFVPLERFILRVATDDAAVLELSATLVPAMLVGTYLNLLVSTITSGVFSGMGRPIIATILSFGFELPMSIGGVAVYILVMHGQKLSSVYWWNAISGALEVMVVMAVLFGCTNWDYWARAAQQRQEAGAAAAAAAGQQQHEQQHDEHDEQQPAAPPVGSNDDNLSSPLDSTNYVALTDDEDDEERISLIPGTAGGGESSRTETTTTTRTTTPLPGAIV